jgi:hypothetical protein
VEGGSVVDRDRNVLDLHMSVLLRGLVPFRRLSYQESLYLAEQQASVLLKLAHVHEPPVPVEQLVQEVGLAAEVRDDPTLTGPGQSWFDSSLGEWIIAVNPNQHSATRAFVIAHEIKHSLDDAFGPTLYRPVDVMTTHERSEHAADYFAVSLMAPRLWVERRWRRGHEDVTSLADQFGILPACMRLRLASLGLVDD